MAQQESLSGAALLAAIEHSGKERFPELPGQLQDSIAANVPGDVRLRGLDEVKKHLRSQTEGAQPAAEETSAEPVGSHSGTGE